MLKLGVSADTSLFLCRDRRKGVLTVDGESASGVSTDGVSQLDTDGDLWLGGSLSPPQGLPSHYYTNFVGCVASVVVSDVTLDMTSQRLSASHIEY